MENSEKIYRKFHESCREKFKKFTVNSIKILRKLCKHSGKFHKNLRKIPRKCQENCIKIKESS